MVKCCNDLAPCDFEAVSTEKTLASGSNEMLIIGTTEELSLQSLVSSVASRSMEPGSNPWSVCAWLTDPLPRVTSVWLEHLWSWDGADTQNVTLWQAGQMASLSWTAVTSSNAKRFKFVSSSRSRYSHARASLLCISSSHKQKIPL